MPIQNDIQTYSIIPFDKNHQAEINELMSEIQKEFDTFFSSPLSASISDLVNSGDTFWVALNDNKIIGTIGLSRFDSNIGIIRRMFVAKKYRGNQLNIAKNLLDIAMAEAKSRRYTAVYLGTMEQFKAAQRFYIKNNFVQISREGLPDKMTLSTNDTLFYKLKLTDNDNGLT
jgi:N-acetylglutamate synthase-like GNAT family acetyltransferase